MLENNYYTSLISLDKTSFNRTSLEEFEYENSVDKNQDLILRRKSRVNNLDSEIESFDKQISLLTSDSADKEKEIQDFRMELSLLQQHEDFDNKDLAGKEKMFDDLYKKKEETDRGGK